ncbi:MAG: CHAT domain-containing protein [Marinifilaceae bacterium]
MGRDGYAVGSAPHFPTHEKSILQQDTSLKALYDQSVGALRNGDFINAEESFQKTVELLEQSSDFDPNLAYRIYMNFGVLKKKLGKMEEALQFYQRTENLVQLHFKNDFNKLGLINLNQGNIYTFRGDILKAEKFYNEALFNLKKDSKKNLRWLALLYNNLGIICKNKKQWGKALSYYSESLDLKKKFRVKDLSSNYTNMANCYNHLKDFEKAIYYHKLSIEETIRNNSIDSYLLGNLYMNFAVFLFAHERNEEALLNLGKAYQVYSKNMGGSNPYIAQCLNNYGTFYLKMGKRRKALDYFQKSLNSELENYSDNNIYHNPIQEQIDPQISILSCLKGKAYAFYELYAKDTREIKDLKIALETFDLCLVTIDRIRIAYQDEESRLILSENEKETYTKSIELALQLYKETGEYIYKEKAFYYAERSKSASLMASLRDVNAKEFGGIPAELQKQEQEVRKGIAKYRAAVYEERKKLKPSRKKIAEWQNELFNLNVQYEEMVKTFELEYPDYFALKYDARTIDVKELQEHLGEGEVFVEYSISDSALFSFIISSNDFQIQRQSINKSELDKNIESVRKCLKTNDFSQNSFEYYKTYIHSAHQLYQQLLFSFDSMIHQKKLVIVPDDKLAYLPFGVLLKQNGDSSKINYRNLDYLLKDHTITYQNSATLGFKNTQKEHESSKVLLAFAPSYNDVSDSILYVERAAYRDKLFPLPGVKEEVKNISKVIEGDLYVDELATEENFKKNAINYDVLHLAMHTIIDDENPMFSKLVFTQNKSAGEDGLLNTHEIYNMNFNARMVVLSACNTGDGKLLKGEGVMSLARGFFYAGCPSIVMTLWTVEDKSGSSLMTYFYQFLGEGMSKDAALRAAKMEYLKNADPLKAHPYFWSGYVTLGDTSVMYDGGVVSKGKYLALLLLFCFPIYYLFRRRKLNR